VSASNTSSSVSVISNQWVPEPDDFMRFSEISTISEKKVLNVWNKQAIHVAKGILDKIMLQQVQKSEGTFVRSIRSHNSSREMQFDISEYVSVNLDALLHVGNIIPSHVVEWWQSYFKKVYDDFHRIALSCHTRDVMFLEQLKAYAENMRTMLLVTSCNTINVQVQSAVIQMREIVKTARDTQNAAVVIVASRSKEVANLQQRIDGIRLSQQAASIYPAAIFRSYQAVADLQSDGDIWDVMRTAAASDTATSAWDEAVSTSAWSVELLPEVCMGDDWKINHSNIINIENDLLLTDIEIYALLATAAASPRISNGQKVVVLSSQSVRNACMNMNSSNSSSSKRRRTRSSSNSSNSSNTSSSTSSNISPFSPTLTAKISEADSVLFAVNTDTYGKGWHWVLCILKPKQSRLMLFDSMKSVSDIDHIQSIRQLFQQLCGDALVLEEVALHQQSDKVSCGYHVVINGISYIHYNTIQFCGDDEARKLVKVLAKLMVGYWVVKRKPAEVNMFEQLVDNLMETAKQQLLTKIPASIVDELDDKSDVILDTENKMESLFGWMINEIKNSSDEQSQDDEQLGSQQVVLPTPEVHVPPPRRTRRT
jgi:hypothetical protein